MEVVKTQTLTPEEFFILIKKQLHIPYSKKVGEIGFIHGFIGVLIFCLVGIIYDLFNIETLACLTLIEIICFSSAIYFIDKVDKSYTATDFESDIQIVESQIIASQKYIPKEYILQILGIGREMFETEGFNTLPDILKMLDILAIIEKAKKS
ncbi:hypothetical protein [Snodgrassella communis]|uniref:Uncharacterized protein n=1 Tax=Snodgrassella alvi TaxID=1196083 RepID=A0A2N9XWU1_9NEIS|nr:hypothetical protein [Snodgrassella communis]PIT54246.1 hypothetical protein BHC48_00750 [Snodgrassella communis]